MEVEKEKRKVKKPLKKKKASVQNKRYKFQKSDKRKPPILESKVKKK